VCELENINNSTLLITAATVGGRYPGARGGAGCCANAVTFVVAAPAYVASVVSLWHCIDRPAGTALNVGTRDLAIDNWIWSRAWNSVLEKISKDLRSIIVQVDDIMFNHGHGRHGQLTSRVTL